MFLLPEQDTFRPVSLVCGTKMLILEECSCFAPAQNTWDLKCLESDSLFRLNGKQQGGWAAVLCNVCLVVEIYVSFLQIDRSQEKARI